MPDQPPLKLLANDDDDLAVISAMLQDALVPTDEMTWQRDDGRFVLMVNRFRWETTPEHDQRGAIHERIHTGLCFEHVTQVRRRGFATSTAGGLLSLLALRHQALPDGGSVIDLTFSGGAEIRLEVSQLSCRFDDVDRPWPTRQRPAHQDIVEES